MKTIHDGDYCKLILDEREIESNYPVYLVIKLEYTEEWGDSPEYKYHCTVIAVSPDFAEDGISEYLKSYSLTKENYDSFPLEGKLEFLADSGCYAYLWQQESNNERKLIQAAKEECKKIQFLFGFYMDRQQNALGATGWDWIRGDVMGAKK